MPQRSPLQVRSDMVGRKTNRPAALRAMGFDARSTPCFRLENAAGERARLYVYDVIGGWDLDTVEFVQAVHAVKAPAIDLHINSPGGFVFDAVSMHAALREHPATVATHVDGLAASAASFLALAGDTVDTASGSRWMIHDAQGVAIGSPAEVRDYADLLDAVSDDIAGYYSNKAGGSVASWRKSMQATTWYTAQQAVDAGLADRVMSGASNKASVDARSQMIMDRHAALRHTMAPADVDRLIRARHAALLAAQKGNR